MAVVAKVTEDSGVRRLQKPRTRKTKKKVQANLPTTPKQIRKKIPLNPDKMSAVDQIVYILSYEGKGKKASRKHLTAGIVGAAVGGSAPLSSYILTHNLLMDVHPLELYKHLATYLVLGGLLYSAPTVYDWVKKAFSNDTFVGKVKPAGFVILLEGTMISAEGHWVLWCLGLMCLGILVFINAIASGCRYALQRTID